MNVTLIKCVYKTLSKLILFITDDDCERKWLEKRLRNSKNHQMNTWILKIIIRFFCITARLDNEIVLYIGAAANPHAMVGFDYSLITQLKEPDRTTKRACISDITCTCQMYIIWKFLRSCDFRRRSRMFLPSSLRGRLRRNGSRTEKRKSPLFVPGQSLV